MRHLIKVDFNARDEAGRVRIPKGQESIPYTHNEPVLLSDLDGNSVQGVLTLSAHGWVAEMDMTTWRDGEPPGVKIIEEELPLPANIQAPDLAQCVNGRKGDMSDQTKDGKPVSPSEKTSWIDSGPPVPEPKTENALREDAIDAMIGSMFDTAKPSGDQQELMQQTRLEARQFARHILDRGNGMNACTKIALRKLQEAVMYANRAVLEID